MTFNTIGGTKGMIATVIFIFVAYIVSLPNGLIKFPDFIDRTPVVEEGFHAVLFIVIMMFMGEPVIKAMVKLMDMIPGINKIPGTVTNNELKQAFGFGRR